LKALEALALWCFWWWEKKAYAASGPWIRARPGEAAFRGPIPRPAPPRCGDVLNGVSIEATSGRFAQRSPLARHRHAACWGCCPRHPAELNFALNGTWGALASPAHESKTSESQPGGLVAIWLSGHLDLGRLLPLAGAAAQPRPCGPQPGSDSLVPEARASPQPQPRGPVPGQNRQGPSGALAIARDARLSLRSPKAK